jgi:phosphoserine phosphatase
MPLDIILQAQDFTSETRARIIQTAAGILGSAPAVYSPTCQLFENISLERNDPKLLELSGLCRASGIDAAFVPAGMKLTDFKAFFFDMDSTFVRSETLDEMAAIEGLGKECAAITQAAMDGTLKDYAASLRARVKLLEGRSTRSIEMVWANMRLFEGLETLVRHVLSRGLRVYIVSSGFTIFTERIAARYGLTGTCSNVIGIDGDTFTGSVSGPAFAPFNGRILDAGGKLEFVTSTMARLGGSPKECVCFGDGSNDVKMLSAAGLAIGNHPKAVLLPHCDLALQFMTYESVLNLFADVRAQRS